MESDLIPLPKWIIITGKVGHLTYSVPMKLMPLKCTNCNVEWYPRIKRDGEIIIPGTCPYCRTKAWRKKRK